MRGKWIPIVAKTCWVYPEQSNPYADVPPNEYGTPKNLMAFLVRFDAIAAPRAAIPPANF